MSLNNMTFKLRCSGEKGQPYQGPEESIPEGRPVVQETASRLMRLDQRKQVMGKEVGGVGGARSIRFCKHG